MDRKRKIGAAFFREVCNGKFDSATRVGMQKEIREHLLLNSNAIRARNFRGIAPADLGTLFQLTDELFFCGRIGRFVEANFEKPLTFRLSTRMTKAGGTTTMIQSHVNPRETSFEIAIATTPLFSSFKLENESVVGGVKCSSRLEALQKIMEHEIMHLVELLGTGDSNCHARPFRSLVRNYFGHRESNHQLMTPTDVARKQHGIRCGDSVVFRIDGTQRKGYVNRITKRATVLVKDASGEEYCDGVRYLKFYVPLPMLKRA